MAKYGGNDGIRPHWGAQSRNAHSLTVIGRIGRIVSPRSILLLSPSFSVVSVWHCCSIDVETVEKSVTIRSLLSAIGGSARNLALRIFENLPPTAPHDD
jgi:hypothetical protein